MHGSSRHHQDSSKSKHRDPVRNTLKAFGRQSVSKMTKKLATKQKVKTITMSRTPNPQSTRSHAFSSVLALTALGEVLAPLFEDLVILGFILNL